MWAEPFKIPLFEFYDLHPPLGDLLAEAKAGLTQPQKSIPPKFFYDEEGSRLFNEICALKEYYLTRTEIALLNDKRKEIEELFQESFALIEYGCGSSEKIRILLDSTFRCQAYAAIDISKKPLLTLTNSLAAAYPTLEIIALCADFVHPLEIPLNGKGPLKKIAFFPGSSIGNFGRREAQNFLSNIARTVGSNGGLLIGVDLKKDPKLLHAAYNDSKGVTALFNKNLLHRINRECGSAFDPSAFEHRAFYNEAEGRIEMHLVSLKDQQVELDGDRIEFGKGETLHTENSYKYEIEEFQSLAARAGWRPRKVWTDSQDLFSIHYLEVGQGTEL